MLKTAVDFIDNKPFINVDGKICSPLAYTTYFDECGEWKDFIAHGYRMFFVNVSFTDLPINNVTGFTPFRTGIFETDIPDYSQFDKIVQSIIEDCPDALIFPRINIAMPRKWIKENPYETVNTPTGSRESLFSEAFKRDGAELLKNLFHTSVVLIMLTELQAISFAVVQRRNGFITTFSVHFLKWEWRNSVNGCS